MQARATVFKMVEKCGREDGSVEGVRVAQPPIPNHIDDGEDECRCATYTRVVGRVVLEAHLPDDFEPSRLLLLLFGDFRIGANARGDKKGLFVRLEVVGGRGNDAPKVVLFMGFVVARL